MYTTTGVERQAKEILTNPESYQGLRPLDDYCRIFLMWSYPSFDHYKSWSLFSNEKQFVARRVVWDKSKEYPRKDPVPFTFGAEAIIPDDIAENLLEKLENIEIKAFKRTEVTATDGTTYGFSVNDPWYGLTVNWHSVYDRVNKSFLNWYTETVETLERYLPSSVVKPEK